MRGGGGYTLYRTVSGITTRSSTRNQIRTDMTIWNGVTKVLDLSFHLAQFALMTVLQTVFSTGPVIAPPKLLCEL